MKNRIVYLLSSLLIILSACSHEEEDFFSLSASERIADLLERAETQLVGSEKGWMFEYFATSESEGAIIFLQFNKPDYVKAAIESPLTDYIYYEAISSYDLISEHRALLTFPIYNEVIHLFSDPDVLDDLSPGVGLGGDYEFEIREVNEDRIKVRGKKNKIDLWITRYTEDYSWEEYMHQASSLDTAIFVKGAVLRLMIEDVTYCLLENGYNHVFTINSSDGLLSQNLPFLVVKDGIKLFNPIRYQDSEIYQFTVNADTTALIAEGFPELQIRGADLSLLLLSGQEWTIPPTSMSASSLEKYTQTSQELITAQGASRMSMSLKLGKTSDSMILSVTLRVGRNDMIGQFTLNTTTLRDDQIQVSYSGSADETGHVFYNQSEGLKEFIQQLSGTINLSSDAAFNPGFIRMENQANPQVWVELYKK